MKIINLFPLSVIQEKILLDQEKKSEMTKEIRSMVLNSKNKNYKKMEYSWTGDTQGFEYLSKNNKFKDLFEQIKIKIKNYIEHLKINENAIEFYITRSWATVSNGQERIIKHRHKQSHISFAYYLKKSKEDSNLVFIDDHFQNEIIPGIFGSTTASNQGIIKELNLFNARSVDIKVEEDDIIIFPSKALHGTQSNIMNNERISISGDIVCVAKDSLNLETMMPPLKNWEKI